MATEQPQPQRIGDATGFPRGIEVTVRDNGPGMTSEVLEQALEPLFSTRSRGTGLELPAAERILRAHRGGLEINSTPGDASASPSGGPSPGTRERPLNIFMTKGCPL